MKVPASIACLENKLITSLLERADVRGSEVNMQAVAARPRGVKRSKPSEELSRPQKSRHKKDKNEELTDKMLSALDWLEPNRNQSHDPELECLRHRAMETLNEIAIDTEDDTVARILYRSTDRLANEPKGGALLTLFKRLYHSTGNHLDIDKFISRAKLVLGEEQ